MRQWEPNAKGRLEQAALELYGEQGYERTTVTEIAERAGLTERTYFRYFADKREVLFGLQDELLQVCVESINTAPGAATPIEIAMRALESIIPMLQERQAVTRQRQSVIAAHPALQERELLKSEKFTGALADALRRRGVPDPAAHFAAHSAGLVFKTAYARWLAGGEDINLAELVREAFHQLRQVLSLDNGQ